MRMGRNLWKAWALWAAVWPFFGFPAAASKLHPLAEKFKMAGPPRLVITRYSGHAGFSSQQALAWEPQGDLYFSANAIHTNVRIGPCESHLSTQQKFPLFKMASTNYLQRSDIPFYLRLGESFQPEQINFLQAARDIPRDEAYEILGPDLEHRKVDLIQDYDKDTVPIVTATMWTVAGQALDAKSGQVRQLDLPWQRDPERKEMARTFDRSKYKIVFEWGRTAQDLPREAEPLAAACAAINYQEVLALGGGIQDAYIMFHSFDEVNTRAYSLRFPDSLYPKSWTNKKDALFLVPLTKVLQAFPPSRHSGKLARLIALSGGKLDEITAIEFMQRFQRIQFTQLDYQENLKSPIAIHDLSLGAAYRRAKLVYDYGLPETDALQQLLMNQQGLLPTWNSGQYTDLADTAYSLYYYQSQNAVEISNLDVQAARTDTTYVPRLLIAAYVYYLKALVPGEFDPSKVAQAIDFLRTREVKFGITTFEKDIASRVRMIHPSSEYKFEYEGYEGGNAPEFQNQEWISKGYSQEARAFFFTVPQIGQLIAHYPQLYRQAMNAARENAWARHHMLSHPDVF